MDRNNELVEPLNVLGRYKRLLWILPLLSTTLGAVGAYLIPPKWEVSAVLEMGQAVGKPVETSANALTRMTHPSFKTGTLKLFAGSPAEIGLAWDEYRTLKVSQVKGTELLEVELQSKSPERGASLVQNVIQNVRNIHSEMLAVSLERNAKQIQLLDQDIASAEVELNQLKKKLAASHSWNSFDATLSATVLQNKSVDIREMKNRRLLLEEQISPSRTYTTKVVGDIFVSEEPVSPNKIKIILLALMLGLGSAVAIAFMHNAFTNKSAQQS